jgi:hypothetical protein
VTVTCLVKQASTFFTQRLARNPERDYLAWIDGLYGIYMELDKYDQALLVATGIGIAAQLSYLCLLVETSLRGNRRRDIFVAWELDHRFALLSRSLCFFANGTLKRIWTMSMNGCVSSYHEIKAFTWVHSDLVTLVG